MDNRSCSFFINKGQKQFYSIGTGWNETGDRRRCSSGSVLNAEIVKQTFLWHLKRETGWWSYDLQHNATPHDDISIMTLIIIQLNIRRLGKMTCSIMIFIIYRVIIMTCSITTFFMMTLIIMQWSSSVVVDDVTLGRYGTSLEECSCVQGIILKCRQMGKYKPVSYRPNKNDDFGPLG